MLLLTLKVQKFNSKYSKYRRWLKLPRVTQSTEDGLEVECEGNLSCEIIGDGTVVATSEDNNMSISTSATMLNQSDIIESENDLDAIDEQELGSRITAMVNRLLERIFA
jgi:hypothetical protein